MNLDFKKLFDSTPRVVDIAIGVALSSLSMGFAMAIVLGDQVQIGENLSLNSRQAISNQKDLAEQAKHAAQVIPEQQIEELKQSIEQSRTLLDNNSTN